MTEAAPPRHFTPDYVEHAVLRDGTPVVLRLTVPADKQLLKAGFDRWSAESRYARFLAPKSALTDDELAYLTEVDQENHFAMGAILADGTGNGQPVGVGIARFIRLDDPKVAEAAIAVSDDMKGRGLGRLLFNRLCAAAAERGIERFRCEVLGSNTSMKALIDDVSPEHTTHVGGGVMSIDMVLPNVTPTQSPEEPPKYSVLYRLFRAAAENAVEWTVAIRRLWSRER